MKLLHVINSLGGGGRERRMTQVAMSLCSSKEVTQAIITLSEENAYAGILASGIPIHIVRGGRSQRLKEFDRILKDMKPDIVHVWLETPTELTYFSLAKFRYKYKLIVGFLADGNIVKGLSRKIGIRLSFWAANCIVSNSWAGVTAKMAPKEKSRVIYNGFDFSRLQPVDKEMKRKELGVSEDQMMTVMCASMTVVKDWNSFFETAYIAQKRDLPIVFLAVGGGPMLNYYEEISKSLKLKNLRLLGKRTDVEEILQVADASILFTNNERHAEGVSNSIMESMAVGLPVIATEGGGTGEIISDKENGYIIKPKDCGSAVEILCSLWKDSNLAEQIGRNARQTIENKFRMEDKMQEYVKLYQNLL